MDRSRYGVPPSLDAFLTAILGECNPASAATFAAEILREDHFNPSETGDERARRNTVVSHEDWLNAVLYGMPETSAADILREYNFNPDEPRDWRGRWTKAGSQDDRLSAVAYAVPRTTGDPAEDAARKKL